MIPVSTHLWTEIDNKLVRKFKFSDFKTAMQFIIEVAEVCNRMNHHPFWSNEYSTVTIKICTHDEGNIVTQKDHDFALQVDQIASRML